MWSANLTINHEGDYKNVNTGVNRTDVEGYTTVDLQASYELPASGWKARVGANNLLDADFPFFDGYYGVDSAHVDFRRRVFFVDVVKEFTW